MRTWRGVLGAGAALALCAACGGVGSGGESGSDDGGGRIDTMGFSLQDVIATTRMDIVKETYPDLKVQVAEGGFDEQQFLSAVASGEPPSLVYVDRTELGSYAARGALVPVDDCIEQEDIDMDLYRDAAVQQVTYDGHVYGIPEFNNVRIVLADDSAGDLPDLSDWSAIRQFSKQESRSKGGAPSRIGFDPKIPEFFPLWVAANGGQLVADDGRSVSLNSPEAVEALEYTVSLVETTAPWAKFKAFRDTWDFFGGKNQFVRDQVGAFPMEDWYIDVLAEVSPDVDVKTAAFRSRDGEPITYSTGLAWALPKGGANQEAACKFMKTMTATDTWVAAAKASKADREKSGGAYTGTFTANVEADEQIMDEVYEPTGHEDLDAATQLILDVQDAAISDPMSPAGAEIKKAWEDAVLRALEGEQSAQEALDQAQQEAERALENAGD